MYTCWIQWFTYYINSSCSYVFHLFCVKRLLSEAHGSACIPQRPFWICGIVTGVAVPSQLTGLSTHLSSLWPWLTLDRSEKIVRISVQTTEHVRIFRYKPIYLSMCDSFCLSLSQGIVWYKWKRIMLCWWKVTRRNVFWMFFWLTCMEKPAAVPRPYK